MLKAASHFIQSGQRTDYRLTFRCWRTEEREGCYLQNTQEVSSMATLTSGFQHAGEIIMPSKGQSTQVTLETGLTEMKESAWM